MSKHVIVGTAGHVDHGKTVLIKALTGFDTDRLQEEKKRGISIDLGFAPFALPSGRVAGIVDVPGHERFIHNMLAGAAGLDLVMLVVDASEGVMPQTREHLNILQLLSVQKGIVVITKIDLVDEEWRELVVEEISSELIGTFMHDAPIIAVSALKGEGIDELKMLIDQSTTDLLPRNAAAPLKLPVDRSFVIDGFGTVVTGTLIQGSVLNGETVEIIPPGIEARVRNIQVHDSDVEHATAGSRVALNLSGVEKAKVQRGSVIAKPGVFRQTLLIDVAVNILESAARPLKNLEPTHIFLGSARTVGKFLLLDRDELKSGEKALAQCRLESPLVADRGDHYVIRSYSPMTTIGGGRVLDPCPDKHRRFRKPVIERLKKLDHATDSGEDLAFIAGKLEELIIADISLIEKETRLDQEQVVLSINKLLTANEIKKIGISYILTKKYHEVEHIILLELEKYHKLYPLSPGMSKARMRGFLPPAFSLKTYDQLLAILKDSEQIEIKDGLVCLSGFKPTPSHGDRKLLDTIAGLYHSAKMQPPSVKDVMKQVGVDLKRADELLNYLINVHAIVKLDDNFYMHKKAIDEAETIVINHFEKNKTITLAEFRDLSKSSRKYAQAILEYFDRNKLTKRVDDYRVPLKMDL